MNHKQKIIQHKLGLVLVDEGIAQLVEWFNDFPSVLTTASCEGENGVDAMIFFEAHPQDIIEIAKQLEIWYYDSNVSLEMGYNPVIPSSLPLIKYTLTFKTETRFRMAMEIVKKSKV